VCNGLRPNGQMTIRTFLASITILTFLSSCTTGINVTDYFDTEKSLTLTVYTLDKSTGLTTARQSEIRSTTEKFNKFVNWCKTNNEDWESSPASFVGEFTMTQDDFGLLYINNGVVIHFLDKEGKPRQYTKTAKKGDFEFLLSE
jgi:hypothetical protein